MNNTPIRKQVAYVAPPSSGYHYCTTSFNIAWTQVLRRFCLRHVGDSLCWGSLAMVPAKNKVKRLSSVSHTTKTIHHHHHHLYMIFPDFTRVLLSRTLISIIHTLHVLASLMLLETLNLFTYFPETYPKSSKTSKMELFNRVLNTPLHTLTLSSAEAEARHKIKARKMSYRK